MGRRPRRLLDTRRTIRPGGRRGTRSSRRRRGRVLRAGMRSAFRRATRPARSRWSAGEPAHPSRDRPNRAPPRVKATRRLWGEQDGSDPPRQQARTRPGSSPRSPGSRRTARGPSARWRTSRPRHVRRKQLRTDPSVFSRIRRRRTGRAVSPGSSSGERPTPIRPAPSAPPSSPRPAACDRSAVRRGQVHRLGLPSMTGRRREGRGRECPAGPPGRHSPRLLRCPRRTRASRLGGRAVGRSGAVISAGSDTSRHRCRLSTISPLRPGNVAAAGSQASAAAARASRSAERAIRMCPEPRPDIGVARTRAAARGPGPPRPRAC